MQIDILGTPWTIEEKRMEDDRKLTDKYGYCDVSSKSIVVSDMEEEAEEPDGLNDYTVLKAKVIRHEIIHAMLYESGLHECSEFGMNEELVDWIAIQLPKMEKVMREIGVL